MTERSRAALAPRAAPLIGLALLGAVVTGCGDAPVDQADPSTTASEPPSSTELTPAPDVIEETADPGAVADTVTAVVEHTDELVSFGRYMAVTETAVALGEGPYTVFAPTNDAFDVLGTDPYEQLSEQPQELEQMVRMHVVEGAMTVEELDDGEILTTLAGGQLEVQRDGDTVTVNGAEVVLAGLQASNGVVHGIGEVLTVDEG